MFVIDLKSFLKPIGSFINLISVSCHAIKSQIIVHIVGVF